MWQILALNIKNCRENKRNASFVVGFENLNTEFFLDGKKIGLRNFLVVCQKGFLLNKYQITLFDHLNQSF